MRLLNDIIVKEMIEKTHVNKEKKRKKIGLKRNSGPTRNDNL